MNGYCLELSKVRVSRRNRLILDIDDLRIPRGEAVGIIGPNGSGKTTLLNVCCGLVRPSAGAVRLNGLDLSSLSAWAKSNLRKDIGYIPQSAEYNAHLPFTVREIAAMGRTSAKPLFRRLNRTDYRQTDQWIDRLGLADRRNQTFRSLSGGEQQKTLLARAMIQDPSMLLLDEPGANLDFTWKFELRNLIDELFRATGITVLTVSHEIDLLPRSCRRVVLMRGGRIAADGPPGQVLTADTLQNVYEYPLKIVNTEGHGYSVVCD